MQNGLRQFCFSVRDQSGKFMMTKVLATTARIAFRFAVLIFLFYCYTDTPNLAFAQSPDTGARSVTLDGIISGEVTTDAGQPIENFVAKLKIVRRSVLPRRDQLVKSWKIEGTFGKLEKILDSADRVAFFDAAKRDRHASNFKNCVELVVSATGYVDAVHYAPLDTFHGNFPAIQLRESIKIKGRFKTATDKPESDPINGVVMVVEELGQLPTALQYERRFTKRATLEDDGSFELSVPKSSKLHLTVLTDSAAPWTHRVSATPPAVDRVDQPPPSEISIGEHSLPAGVRVKGIVIDRENSPAIGQVVQLYHDTNAVQFVDTAIRSFVVTDSLGQFELPPHLGKVTISLVKNGTTFDGRSIAVPGEPMAATPIVLDLKANSPVQFLEIKETNLWKVHGNLKIPDGAKFSEFRIAITSGSSRNKTRWLSIDDNGKFKFESVEGAGFRLDFHHETAGERVQVQLEDATYETHSNQFTGSPFKPAQNFEIKPLKQNLGPLWFNVVRVGR